MVLSESYGDGFSTFGCLTKGVYIFGSDGRLHLDIHTLEYGLFAMYGAHGYPLATIFADAYA